MSTSIEAVRQLIEAAKAGDLDKGCALVSTKVTKSELEPLLRDVGEQYGSVDVQQLDIRETNRLGSQAFVVVSTPGVEPAEFWAFSDSDDRFLVSWASLATIADRKIAPSGSATAS